MKTARQPGGKVMLIQPESGTWQPGSYLVDIPAEGMFGGRTYYQFYIDGPDGSVDFWNPQSVKAPGVALATFLAWEVWG